VLRGFSSALEGPTVVNVSVALAGELLVMEIGLVLPNEQVGASAPVTTGAMLHESVTVPVNPFAGVTVTLACDELPGLTVAGLDAPAEREKLVGAVDVTVRLSVVVSVRLPDVPVMVTVDWPAAAELLAVSVSVLVVVVLVGLNDAVTPVGSPEAARLTLPVKPPEGVTVIVLVLFPPCATLTLLGDAESV
jgi:hypothetical protein